MHCLSHLQVLKPAACSIVGLALSRTATLTHSQERIEPLAV
jgi:hypothetical protein